MAKPKQEINPVCGQRLKALIKESGKSQTDVAAIVGIAKEHLNKVVNSHAPLTMSLATKIINMVFPDTRVEWLLGYTDFRTDEDEHEHLSRKFDREMQHYENRQQLHQDTIKLYLTCFYTESPEHDSAYHISHPLKLKKARGSSSGPLVEVSDIEGNVVGYLDYMQYQGLLISLDNYAKYLVTNALYYKMPIKEALEEEENATQESR